jgi:uncharacterized protein (DUF1501 family)
VIFNRRQFMCGAAATTLSMPAFMRALAAEASGNLILVSILLDGGNDGLNTVIPITTTQYGAYTTLRQIPGGGGFLGVLESDITAAGTAFDPNYQTPASMATQYAFHPNMTALRALYGQGKVAVLMGVGIPPADDNRTSHEVGKFDWASGTINQLGYSNVGWLGQTFDQIGGTKGAIPDTVSLNYTLPTLLQGVKNAPLVLGGDIGNFAVPCGDGGTDCTNRLTDLASNDSYASQYMAGEFSRALASSTTSYISVVQGYAKAVPGTSYPPIGNSGLRSQLKQIARLIQSGAPSRAYYASQGGYDTHSNQNLATSQPGLLADLSGAISDFYTYLAANNLSKNVVLMTYSDFGRRVQANSTAGTDHGTSNVAFIVGDPIKPGVYGQYSDLTKLDVDGNPLIQVDFRNHISDLVNAMGGDAAEIVGTTYPKLGYI